MAVQHVDVLIIGAGLSGIGAACHLPRECPDTSYAILEARAPSAGPGTSSAIPGIRSDSDMYTLGYRSGRGPRRSRSPTARRS